MSSHDSKRIAAYYDALAERHSGCEAVDAASQASLETRYRVLADAVDLTGKRVLDAGCGFGGLGMHVRGRYENVDYVGIDVSRGLVDRGRRDHPELQLEVADVLAYGSHTPFDVVLAQGIFYLLTGDAETKMERLIDAMWALASECVAFTALSSWATGRIDPGEFRVDPVRVLDYCRALTPHLVLRHDYHPGDVGLYLYRE